MFCSHFSSQLEPVCVNGLRHSQSQSTSCNLQGHVSPPDLAGHHAAGSHPWVWCSCWAVSQQWQSPSQRGSLHFRPISAALGLVSLRNLLIWCSLARDKLLTAGCLLTASRTDSLSHVACLAHQLSHDSSPKTNEEADWIQDRSLNRKEHKFQLLTL